MKAWFLLVPLMLGVAASQVSAADSGGLGGVLKDAATDAAGQAARDTIDKTAPRSDRDRDVRDRDRRDDRDRDVRDRDRRDRDVRDRDRRDDRDREVRDRDRSDDRNRDRDRRDRDYRDRDRRDGPGNSYEHRRDGRGAQDNPGRGKKNRDD